MLVRHRWKQIKDDVVGCDDTRDGNLTEIIFDQVPLLDYNRWRINLEDNIVNIHSILSIDVFNYQQTFI